MKLNIAFPCGDDNRVIYLRKDGRIQIGCSDYTQAEAVTAVTEKYGYRAEDYIAKINACFEGVDYEDSILTHEDWQVRRAVAEQGYGLETLVNDGSWQVRIAVAEQGYGLETLVNDKDCDVRRAAEQKLKELNR